MSEPLRADLYEVTPDTVDNDWPAMAVEAVIRGSASAVRYHNKVADAAQRLHQAQRLGRIFREDGAIQIHGPSKPTQVDLQQHRRPNGLQALRSREHKAALAGGLVTVGQRRYGAACRVSLRNGTQPERTCCWWSGCSPRTPR